MTASPFADPTARLAPPPSDVSTGVGLAGLIGLFVWIIFCRSYTKTR